MKDVFISYSRDDAEIAQSLARRLETDGISVWIDYKDIEWGQLYPRSIEEGLDETRHIICLMSPSWERSAWCKVEHYSTMVDDPDNFIGKILPILLSKDTAIPRFIKPLAYKDFTEPNALEKNYPAIRTHILTTRKDGHPTAPMQLIDDDGYHLPAMGYIFVVGNPGAGKSTFCRFLESELKSHGVIISRKSDYPFLQALYRLDLARGDTSRFESDSRSEFKIKDPAVYDEVLKLIHDEVMSTDVPANELRLIEFSRPHYDSCFLHYTIRALVNSAIVHIDANIDVCKQRNENRKNQLELRMAGVEPDPDAFDFDPDMHYVPNEVYDQYSEAASEWDDQSLVLALMPARAYFKLDNDEQNLEDYKNRAVKLICEKIAPLVQIPEPLNDFYRRRIQAMESFVSRDSD